MTTILKNIRFQKLDQFNNPVFICNQKEKNIYKKLTKFASQLQSQFEDCFLPIYHSIEHEYCTIRLRKNTQIDKLKLKQNDRVDMSFSVKRKKTNNKIYVNCVLKSIKLVSRTLPLDYGSDVELYDVNTDEDTDEE